MDTALAKSVTGGGEIIQAQEQSFLMPAVPVRMMLDRYNAIVELTRSVLKVGIDYGTIPGTEKKNDDGTPSNRSHTLLKPGAEKLCSFFGLVPEFEELTTIEDFEKGLFYYKLRCRLSRNGRLVATAIGSANSREKKYRREARVCPNCSAPTIKKSKFAPRGSPRGTKGGWYCEAKSGGCGTEFAAEDPAILNQSVTSDPAAAADLVNTLQKMAQKRAHVAATLYATNASEFFTQDVEELVGSDDVDAATGEVIESRQQQTRQAPQGESRPQQGRTNAQDMDPAIDISNNDAVIAEWKRRLVERGFTNEAAFLLLGAKLKEKQQSLDDLSIKGREAILWAINQGKFDAQKDEFNAKAAGASVQGEAKQPEPQSVKVHRTDTSDGKLTLDDVKDYDVFQSAWLMAAEAAGQDQATAMAALNKAAALVAKKGKLAETSGDWRLKMLVAADNGALDWQSGKVNEVKQAIGAA